MSICTARLRNTANPPKVRMSGEQIRLQVPPKLFGVNSWIAQMTRQWIPDCWTGDRKCTGRTSMSAVRYLWDASGVQLHIADASIFSCSIRSTASSHFSSSCLSFAVVWAIGFHCYVGLNTTHVLRVTLSVYDVWGGIMLDRETIGIIYSTIIHTWFSLLE